MATRLPDNGTAQPIRFVLLFACLIAVFLPYVWHRSAALTLNSYDLAEFVRVSPAVLTSNPPLIVPLLLRAVLPLLAVGFALNAREAFADSNRAGWLIIPVNLIFCAVLFVWITPPLENLPELLRGDQPSGNFLQWVFIQVVTAVILLMIFVGRRAGYPWAWMQVTIGVLIAACAVNGGLLAFNILEGLSTRQTIGGGLPLTLLFSLLYAGSAWLNARNYAHAR